MTKPYLLACFLSVGVAHAVHAQSLDIGGIELHLGQKVDEALRSLSPYQVQYLQNDSWAVSQKTGNSFQFLGSIGAKNNVIDYLSKIFNFNSPEETPEVYTRASKELRHLGGTTCTTREVYYTDGLIHDFSTQCGPYILSYNMPMKLDKTNRSIGMVTIEVRSKQAR